MKKQLFLLLVTALMAVSSVFAQTRELQIFKGGKLIQSLSVSNIDSVKVVDVGVIPPPVQVQTVDLGLSVKWANMNVGASKAEDYGDYFAWGETSSKATYNWSTYSLCKGTNSTMTKYCNSSYNGTVDNKTTLELVDDAARANWGGSWRMPTSNEWSELNTKCTWKWTTQNSVNGYLVTGPNGNSIFLPAAGYRYEGSLDYAGSTGYYWSSSLDTSNANFARHFTLYSGGHNTGSSSHLRYYGQSVRPVTE